MDNNSTRIRFNEFLQTTGVKTVVISRKFNWDYPNLLKFKNGQVNLSDTRLNLLNDYMDKYLEAIKNL